MVNTKIAVVIIKAREKAEQSVDYTPRHGAVCPECSRKNIPVVTSRPWEGDTRIRYHRCTNIEGCILAIMKTSIKSVQVAREKPQSRVKQ